MSTKSLARRLLEQFDESYTASKYERFRGDRGEVKYQVVTDKRGSSALGKFPTGEIEVKNLATGQVERDLHTDDFGRTSFNWKDIEKGDKLYYDHSTDTWRKV